MEGVSQGVYLLLGSNQGNRELQLQQALERIDIQIGNVSACSAAYETAAWGKTDQPDFLNAAVCVDTTLSAAALLTQVQDIERQFGRQRDVIWGQRTLDIDILFLGREQINTPELQVPHPLMQERRFVLVPLAEIAPGLQHPVSGHTIQELLDQCPDPLEVQRKGVLIPDAL